MHSDPTQIVYFGHQHHLFDERLFPVNIPISVVNITHWSLPKNYAKKNWCYII